MLNDKLYFYTILRICAIFLLSGCDSIKTKENSQKNNFESHNSLSYAKRFSVVKINGFKTLLLFGSKDLKDTTAVFILYPKTEPKPNLIKNAFYIPTPVERVACLSSIYAAMLTKLNLQQKIVAVENVDYYNNNFIVENVKRSKIIELAKGPEINVEQTLVLNPDLILTFGMGNPKKDVSEKIINANIPVAISLDHLEETPLARAEWIKFIAAFFNKEQLADSLFKITETNYKQLKLMCDTIKNKPTVLTEMKYADAWYVPGGNSFAANLMNDAGANYIWKNEKRTGSIPLNFETVYNVAKEADYWLNLFINVNSKKELLGFEPRYNLFTAFKSGNIYNNNKIANAKGYSDYWENGITNPDELLKDLIKIFHPNVLPEYQLKYYKKIE